MLFRKQPILLIVCTANITRSPYLAARLAAELQQAELPRHKRPQVQSAGLHAMDGAGPHPVMRTLAELRGVDLSGHRSRPVSPTLLQQASLVLTMNEEQADQIRELKPEAWVMPLLAWGRPEDWDGETAIEDPTGGEPEQYVAFADIADAQCARLRRYITRADDALA